MNHSAPISPCAGHCRLDRASNICVGCGRRLAEIAAWRRYSETEKICIMQRLNALKSNASSDRSAVSDPRQRVATPSAQALAALRAIEDAQRETPDAAPALIAILDGTSLILAVNRAWGRFASENNAARPEKTGVGTRYLSVCENAEGTCEREADSFGAGLKSVLSGERESFELISPCHSPTERRWFVGRVLRCSSADAPLFAVIHSRLVSRTGALPKAA